MTAITAAELRRNLTRYLDEAIDNCDPITIVRDGGKRNVVLMSERDFASWQETAYLVRSPANAKRLRRSIAELDAGKLQEHELTLAETPNKSVSGM
jgi:antitoxin YefM